MLCLNVQGQWAYPLAFTSVSFPPRRDSTYPAIPLKPKADWFHSSDSLESQTHRQWPWRLLPFASDLGTVGCLLNKPKLGLLGWVIATPYYLYAISKQPDAHRRKDEMLYQVTANGFFPLVEAKIGVNSGEILHQLVSKTKILSAHAAKQSHCKLFGGLLGLITLTPLVGDPISNQVCQKYQGRQLNVTA
jgi:hypothetical protein